MFKAKKAETAIRQFYATARTPIAIGQ